jgi:hypothetical protein
VTNPQVLKVALHNQIDIRIGAFMVITWARRIQLAIPYTHVPGREIVKPNFEIEACTDSITVTRPIHWREGH